MRPAQKAEEIAIVSRVLGWLGIKYDCINEREAPDCTVRLRDGSLIGIEVVTPVVGFDVFGERDRTIETWRKVLDAEGVRGLFRPRFNAGVMLEERGCSRKHRQREARAAAQIARSMTQDTLSLDSTDLLSRRLPRLINLEIHRRDGDLLVLDELHIPQGKLPDTRPVLQGKADRVAQWRTQQPDVDEFWLLWARRPGTLAAPEPADTELAASGFDRVYVVNADNGVSRLVGGTT